MKFYHVQVSTGLITPEHRKRMGIAIWEFIWLLDKVTTIDDYGEGWVLNGKPIKIKEISGALGEHYMTAFTNIKRLVKYKYLNVKRTPYGLCITLCKAKKYIKRDL